MKDITIIYLTLNKLPQHWFEFHKKALMDAIGEDTPLITVSKKPMDWGHNIIQETEGYVNIYQQMYRACKIAKTPWVGIAEDDTLYPKEHFEHRPKDLETFSYNMTRWGIFTWGKPYYFHKYRIANSTLIAPREQLIKAWEERLSKYPLGGMPEKHVGEFGRDRVERGIGVTHQKVEEFWTNPGVVCFNHDYSLDHLERSHRKAPHPVIAYDIPLWGWARDLRKNFR